MNTKELISFDEINLNELDGVKTEVIAGLLKDKKREFKSRGIFKAGIRTNIKFKSMKVNDQYNSLDLVFKDEKAKATCNSRIYPTNSEFYKGDKKAHQRAYVNKIRLVYSLLNTATYPEMYNPSLIDTDEWSVFIREIAKIFNKHNEIGKILIAGVFVVNKSGFVQLRQSFRTNICTMEELNENAIKAEDYFYIDEKFDNFDMPEDNEDDGTTNISPLSGIKYKTFPKDHPIYHGGKYPEELDQELPF